MIHLGKIWNLSWLWPRVAVLGAEASIEIGLRVERQFAAAAQWDGGPPLGLAVLPSAWLFTHGCFLSSSICARPGLS